MKLLKQCGRTLFNVLLLRGRRRLAKFLVVLLVSAALFVFGVSGVSLLDSEDATLQRARGEFEVSRDYEVKQNHGPLRNIKGGQSKQDLNFDDFNVEESQPKDHDEKLDTQVQSPPPGALDGGRGVPASEENGIEKVGVDAEMPKDDNQAISKLRSSDHSPAVEKKEHGDGIPTGAHHTPTKPRKDAATNPPAGGRTEEEEYQKHDAVVRRGTSEEGLPPDRGNDWPGHAEHNRDDELGRIDQLPDDEGKEQVVVMKKKKDPNGAAPVEINSKSQNKMDKKLEEVKPKVEENVRASDATSEPSLPPGVVAIPKKKEVNTQSNGGGQGGVKAVPKVKGAVNGEGERGVEVQMSAVEMAKAIESGEMCKTVCPPFVWSDWSPCSKACGKGRRYRKALYKFVCQSSDLCPLNRIEESVCETPCKFDPEKYGGPNGLDMYPINPLNPAIYPEDKNYMCGHWLVEYEKLHQDILSGKRPPRYLVYSTGKGTYPTAGGIAPRIRGITTTFFLAVLLDRAFMIEWLDPPGLDQYLEPKSFNWADLSKIEGLKRGPVRDIGSWRSAKESSISSQWYMSTNFSTYFTNDVEVVQGHRYDFTYAILRNPELMPKAFELGVDRIKCRICCAFHMLFRMTDSFQQQMDTLLKSLGAPQKSVGAIQVRSKSHNVQEAVKHADAFVKCATKGAKSLKMASRISWVPIFNNRLVVHIVHKKYGDKLKIPINIDTATRTVHTHLGNLPADTELEVAKAVQERTFKEFFLTINSTIIIRKKGYEGSFGNIADAIRRFYHKLGSVHTFLVGNACTKFPDTFKIE